MSKTSNTIADATVLEILPATYQTIYINAINAGKEIGMAPGTTRNMLTECRFLIPTLKIGAKECVIFCEGRFCDATFTTACAS